VLAVLEDEEDGVELGADNNLTQAHDVWVEQPAQQADFTHSRLRHSLAVEPTVG